MEQDETYAQIIEKKSGYKVLNAGVASYGTVKECKLLDRIDLSRLKYLIVHYSNNDFAENNFFFHQGGPRTCWSEKDIYTLRQSHHADL